MSGAVFDLPKALEIVGGDAELLNMVLQVFVDSSPPLWQQLLDPAASHSDDAVREIAHRLKGGAASIAADCLADVCWRIETAARAGDRGIWQTCLPELALQAQAALLAVNEHLQKPLKPA